MYNDFNATENCMNENTIKALTAYLIALKAEGFRAVHLGSVIPMHHQTNFERRRDGLPSWTQFPDITFPAETGLFYDRSSGFVFFSEELFLLATKP